jgi:hypothetical protein
MDKMIKCPRCNRTQPESLGACDWCEDERQARAEELAREVEEGRLEL